MFQAIQRRRDHYAGALVALIGVGTVAQASQYGVGSLATVGPGFFPLVMGVILVVTGIAIAMERDTEKAPETDVGNQTAFGSPEWRGWLGIICGVMSFILLAKTAGLLPATFACVFISALGDRTTTVLQAAVLASAIAMFGCALFYYGLHIQLPPLAWLRP